MGNGNGDTLSQYGTSDQVVTISLNGLTSSATAARQSAVINNADNLPDALVTATFTTGSDTLGADKSVYIYLYGSAGTSFPDGVTGNNDPYTFGTKTNLILAKRVRFSASSQTRSVSFNVAEYFNGIMPSKWGIVVRNYTATILSTASIRYQGRWDSNDYIPPPETPVYSVWTASAMDTLLKSAIPTTNTPVVLKSCKRDRVAFQIGLKGGDDDVTGVSVAVSNLTGAGTINASAAKVYKVGYVTMPDDWSNLKQPDLLLSHTNGWTLAEGDVQPLFIKIDVPYDATAGDYTGTVTITDNNGGSTVVNVNLTVWDILLPETPAIKGGPRLHWEAIQSLEGKEVYSSAGYDMCETWFEYFLADGITPGIFPPRQAADYTDAKIETYVTDPKFTITAVPWLPTNTALLDAWYTAFTALDAGDKMFAYTADEPNWTGWYQDMNAPIYAIGYEGAKYYLDINHGVDPNIKCLVGSSSHGATCEFLVSAWSSGTTYAANALVKRVDTSGDGFMHCWASKAGGNLNRDPATAGGAAYWNKGAILEVPWVSGTSYSPGQLVLHTADDYSYPGDMGIREQLFRCHTAHTAASSTEPYTGASWMTKWEQVCSFNTLLDKANIIFAAADFWPIACDPDRWYIGATIAYAVEVWLCVNMHIANYAANGHAKRIYSLLQARLFPWMTYFGGGSGIMEWAGTFWYRHWTSGTAYTAGEIVIVGDGTPDLKQYKCLTSHTAAAGNKPPHAYWEAGDSARGREVYAIDNQTWGVSDGIWLYPGDAIGEPAGPVPTIRYMLYTMGIKDHLLAKALEAVSSTGRVYEFLDDIVTYDTTNYTDDVASFEATRTAIAEAILDA